MAKKIVISLLVAIIFLYPMQVQNMQNADAAVASKVATLSAKKVAKEVIQDAAVETAANFALMQALEIVGDYEAKPGFKIVCPDGSQSCDKPIQVKESITASDKTAIKGQAGLELDKMINNGKAIPKWQKFLDWFLPVWLVTFGATVLTYALDSDVRSFFNETGYNALVALGFITPIGDISEAEQIEDVILPPVTKENGEGLGGNGESLYHTKTVNSTSSQTLVSMPIPNLLYQNKMIDITVENPNQNLTGLNVFTTDFLKANQLFTYNSTKVDLYNATFGREKQLTLAVNGESVYQHTIVSDSAISTFVMQDDVNILLRKTNAIKLRSPYKIGDFYYTDVLFNTVDGNSLKFQTRSSTVLIPNVKSVESTVSFGTSTIRKITTTMHHDKNPFKQILPPPYGEIEQILNPMDNSSYQDDKGRVAIIPPVAIPLEEEGTGQQVIRVPAANGDGYEFQKPDGTKVPEENVTTGPDPVVTPSPGGQTTPGGEPIPEGTPTVTPTPTPQAPNPEPIPLTPDQTAPPGDGTEPPVDPNPFPEGDTCDVGLKFPKFVPFFNTLSNAFPFSIPWDIERAFIAAFSDIGDERPSFELDIGIGDKKQIVKITTPAFFDDWKPFTDSLIRFIFAVGIMFGIYRFMKGGSS